MKRERKHKSALLILLILTALLFLVGCKSRQTIMEKRTIRTDKTAIWNLKDSLYKKEAQLAILQTDLQRTRNENIHSINEISKHEIFYDTSTPINPDTGKPPIASEVISISKSLLEETKKELETFLQATSIENQNLTKQNIGLQLKIENLTKENEELTAKTSTSPAFNLKIFLTGIILGVIFSVLIYFSIKDY